MSRQAERMRRRSHGHVAIGSLLSAASFQGRFSPDSGHKQAAAQRELRYIGKRCMPTYFS